MYISDNAELAENKLSILYILKNIGLPLTNTALSKIVSEGKLFNFFLLQHLLEDLQNNSYIEKNSIQSGEITYLITPKGSETLDFLLHKLPKGIRKHIDRLTENKFQAIKYDQEIIAYIEPGNSGGFLSILEIKEGDNLLFSVKYTSGTKKDALAICDKFKLDADLFYNLITKEILE